MGRNTFSRSQATESGSPQAILWAPTASSRTTIEKSWTIRDDATYRMGRHTLKAGGQITFFKLSRIQWNGTSTAPISSPIRAREARARQSSTITTASPFAGRININPAPGLNAKDTQVGLYIQDEWKPDDHWTINAGLRWDFETNANNKDYVTPPAIAAALRAYPGWAARGIDPEDYISDGHNRKPFYGAFSRASACPMTCMATATSSSSAALAATMTATCSSRA